MHHHSKERRQSVITKKYFRIHWLVVLKMHRTKNQDVAGMTSGRTIEGVHLARYSECAIDVEQGDDLGLHAGRRIRNHF